MLTRASTGLDGTGRGPSLPYVGYLSRKDSGPGTAYPHAPNPLTAHPPGIPFAERPAKAMRSRKMTNVSYRTANESIAEEEPGW